MTNRVAKNATWIIACKIVQSILGFVINMFTARFLGPSNFGVITYAASLVSFVLPIMKLGLNNIIVQEVVHHPEREGKAVGTMVFMNVISSFVCIIGVTSFAYVANPGEPDTVLVCALYCVTLVFQATEMIHFWFQAKLLSKYTSILGLIAYTLVSAYRIYLLATAKSVHWFALSSALDYLLISVGMFVIYAKKKNQKLSIDFKLAKEMLNKSKHYILSAMMTTIFTQTDKIMLKGMIDSDSTAYYGAAAACAVMAQFVFQALIDSFRPWIFEAQKKNNGQFEYRLKMLYSFIIYLSLLQSVVMTIFADLIVHVVYGEQYMPAAGALRIVVWYTTFAYLGSVRNIWILANDKQKYLWVINICGASANVVLNFALIPFLGIYGAAIASLITQFFTNVIVGYIIRPIRPNNAIMVSSLNPKYCIDAVKKLLKRSPKKAAAGVADKSAESNDSAKAPEDD